MIRFFTETLQLQPTPIPDMIGNPVVFVTTEGNLVTATTVRIETDP
ncbi:MAG: hypothetical protein MO846_08960 [Candidatus Devosia symbiotica]|nr:hypothetical protein [Candidatus Devosia symbiotica]